jgi:hypothetical protein
MGTGGSFPGGKSGENMKLTIHFQLVPRSRKCGVSIRLHGVVLNYLSTETTLAFLSFAIMGTQKTEFIYEYYLLSTTNILIIKNQAASLIYSLH